MAATAPKNQSVASPREQHLRDASEAVQVLDELSGPVPSDLVPRERQLPARRHETRPHLWMAARHWRQVSAALIGKGGSGRPDVWSYGNARSMAATSSGTGRVSQSGRPLPGGSALSILPPACHWGLTGVVSDLERRRSMPLRRDAVANPLHPCTSSGEGDLGIWSQNGALSPYDGLPLPFEAVRPRHVAVPRAARLADRGHTNGTPMAWRRDMLHHVCSRVLLVV